jgi:hypothetical protein
MMGNTGVITNATLSADFSNAVVTSAQINASVAGTNWQMTASNIPIVGSDFKSNTELNNVAVTCGGNCGGTQNIGYINGHFFNKAQGVGINYGMASVMPAEVQMPAPGPTVTPVNMVTGVIILQR